MPCPGSPSSFCSLPTPHATTTFPPRIPVPLSYKHPVPHTSAILVPSHTSWDSHPTYGSWVPPPPLPHYNLPCPAFHLPASPSPSHSPSGMDMASPPCLGFIPFTFLLSVYTCHTHVTHIASLYLATPSCLPILAPAPTHYLYTYVSPTYHTHLSAPLLVPLLACSPLPSAFSTDPYLPTPVLFPFSSWIFPPLCLPLFPMG